MEVKVIKNTNNFLKLKLLAKELDKHILTVGIDPDSPLNEREELFYGNKKSERPYYEDVLTNEKLGYLFEMGYLVSKEGTTAFLEPGCKEVLKKTRSERAAKVKEMMKLEGNPKEMVVNALHGLGKQMVDEVRSRSPEDTGQLKRAIGYEIDDKNAMTWK